MPLEQECRGVVSGVEGQLYSCLVPSQVPTEGWTCQLLLPAAPAHCSLHSKPGTSESSKTIDKEQTRPLQGVQTLTFSEDVPEQDNMTSMFLKRLPH
eukprot:485744-Amphidinium_carterae.1